MSSSASPNPPSPAARDVFLSFLLLDPDGNERDFEELCEHRPDLAEDLHQLWIEWNDAQARRSEPGRAASLSARLSARVGTDVDPGVALLPEVGRDRGEAAPALRRLPDETAVEGTRYRLEGEIGRGGMGAILKVWDSELRRHLAMKVTLERTPLPGAARSPVPEPSLLRRFMEEAQITGQLEHPGIVPVHELGLDAQGRLYFTMRLVRGQDLKRIFDLAWKNEDGWTQTRVVGVLLKVCEALSYAHARGVLHRDLKPANIMVGGFGEVYVMDWGLARVIGHPDRHDLRLAEDQRPVDTSSSGSDSLREVDDDSPLRTRDGDVVGTPAYMPPEQARGELEKLSPRSDVYSVGAMLYHLLARSTPYVAEKERVGPAALLARVLTGPPRSIAEVNLEVPQELAAICDKAMARDPAQRYESTREMAEDFQAYIEGRVVRAYETGAVAEFRKWVQRNRWLASSSAALVLAIILGLGGVSYTEAKARDDVQAKNEIITKEAKRADESAELATQEAQTARREAETSERVVEFLGGMFAKANPYETNGEMVSARAVLDAAVIRIGAELDDEPLIRARLLGMMGNAYRALGLYAEAAPLLHSAVELRRVNLGAEHRDTLASLGDLAFLDQVWGRFAEAEALLQEALATWRRVLGENSREALHAQSLLAGLYHLQGRQEEGEPLARKTLDLQTQTLGESDPDTLLTMGFLVRFHLGQERFEEAEAECLRLLEIQRRERGSEHDETLDALNSLAEVYVRSGRYAEAEPLLDQLLETHRRKHGASSSGALLALNNLAECYFQQGRFEWAEELFQELIRISKSVFGEFHVETVRAETNLAEVLRREGRNDEAEALYKRLITDLRERVPEDNASLVGIAGALARLYVSVGRFAEAEPIIKQVLEHTPPDHPRYAERKRLLDQVIEELEGRGESGDEQRKQD